MKNFRAKVDSKVNCDICGERMLKGSHRVNKRMVTKEFGEIHAMTLYLHEDCYIREEDKWL